MQPPVRTQSCVHLFNTLTEHSLVYAGHCSRHFLTLLCEWCFNWLLWAIAPPPLTVLMSVPFHQASLSPLSASPTPEPPCWGPPPQPLPLKPSQPLGLRLFTSGWLIGWKSRTSVVLVYFFLLWPLPPVAEPASPPRQETADELCRPPNTAHDPGDQGLALFLWGPDHSIDSLLCTPSPTPTYIHTGFSYLTHLQQGDHTLPSEIVTVPSV